jgi:hypothetical protein
VPQLIGHDSEVGHVYHQSLAVSVQPRDASSGDRVEDETLTIPQHPADVEFVVQNASPSTDFVIALRRF